MAHHFFFFHHRTWVSVALFVLATTLGACGGQPPTIDPGNAVSITRSAGAATLIRPRSKSQTELPQSVLLTPDDHLYTAANQTVTLQFPDGSTLQLGPESHLVLFAISSADRVAIFRLLAGSATGTAHGHAFEVQGYREVAVNFSMMVADLAVVPRGIAGTYQLKIDGDRLQATINSGEFDIRSGNQQATLPQGWQAIAEPGKPLQIVPLITPTPAAGAPTAAPIQIISITPTNTPTETPEATKTATRTATYTPTPTRTRVRRTIVSMTATPAIIVDTPLPAATEKPDRPPKPTNLPPTSEPPTPKPPTPEPPTPRPTL